MRDFSYRCVTILFDFNLIDRWMRDFCILFLSPQVGFNFAILNLGLGHLGWPCIYEIIIIRCMLIKECTMLSCNGFAYVSYSQFPLFSLQLKIDRHNMLG